MRIGRNSRSILGAYRLSQVRRPTFAAPSAVSRSQRAMATGHELPFCAAAGQRETDPALSLSYLSDSATGNKITGIV